VRKGFNKLASAAHGGFLMGGHMSKRGIPLLAQSVVDDFYKVVISGWQPTFDDIKERYIDDSHDEKRRNYLTRSLIGRVRRMLKKEGKYFYHVSEDVIEDDDGNGVVEEARYKILTTSNDYEHVTRKLWSSTVGFQNSTDEVLTSSIKELPHSALPLFNEIKAQMQVIGELARITTAKFEEATLKIKGGNKSEDK
jgi:hypothetical protein